MLSLPSQAQLKKCFDAYDQTGTGKISVDILGKIIRCVWQTPSDTEIADYIKEIDRDGTGTFHYASLISLLERHWKQNFVSDGYDKISLAVERETFLEHQRYLMKNKFKNALARLKSSHLFDEYCNEFFGLPTFTIEILSDVHVKQATHIVSEQFDYTTKNASNIEADICQWTYEDNVVMLRSVMKHVVKCGVSVVVMHNEKVVGVALGYDFADLPIITYANNESEPQSMKYWNEIEDVCNKSDAHRSLYLAWMQNPQKHGRIFYTDFGARLQSYSGHNISYGIFQFSVMMIRFCGYEQVWYHMSHPATIRDAKCISMQTKFSFISACFDLSEYEFQREENQIFGKSSVKELLLDTRKRLKEIRLEVQSLIVVQFVVDFRSYVSSNIDFDISGEKGRVDDGFVKKMMLFWKELVIKSKLPPSKL